MIRKPLLMLALLMPAVGAGADVEEILTTAHKASRDALGVVRFTYADETGERNMSGQAICIDASGLFITLEIDARLAGDRLGDFELVRPGKTDEPVPAKLLWVDELTGVGFIETDKPAGWKPISFADTSDLYVGQPVASAGLMPADVGHTPYLGGAHVSAMVRVPSRLVYVTSGNLTRYGSPVFRADGKAVGLVQQQRPLANRFIRLGRRQAPVTVTNRQETSFFLPVDEFADVLARPRKPRRLSWIGVLNFEPVSADIAAVKGIDQPAVRVGTIVDGTPADEADLREGDLVIAKGGKPLRQFATPQLTARHLSQQISGAEPETAVKLTLLREGGKKEVTLKIQPVPQRPWEAPRHYDRTLGLGVRQRVMLDQHLQRTPAPDVPGMIVYAVRSDSPAGKAGFQNNDVLMSLDGKSIRTADRYRAVAADVLASPGRAVPAEIMRGETKQTLQIAVPSR
ncbi:MAG: PDZ domain-containing protein [Planctomycetota bacterium]